MSNKNNNPSIFSLYGDAIPDTLKTPKIEQPKKSVKKVSKKEDEKYKLPQNIRYAFRTFEITSDDMGGHEEVTLEQVRGFLENDYPELSKDRTSMEYDKDKHLIVPILKSSRKGKAGINIKLNLGGTCTDLCFVINRYYWWCLNETNLYGFRN